MKRLLHRKICRLSESVYLSRSYDLIRFSSCLIARAARIEKRIIAGGIKILVPKITSVPGIPDKIYIRYARNAVSS
ncbi:MAG: hypothetical protein ACUVTX_08955, partial [Bacteroidales bacterium]